MDETCLWARFKTYLGIIVEQIVVQRSRLGGSFGHFTVLKVIVVAEYLSRGNARIGVDGAEYEEEHTK